MISGGLPRRWSAKCCAPLVVAGISHALLTSVRNGPGINVLTRTVGPNARASPSVNALSPALAAEYGSCSGLGRRDPLELTLMIDPPPSATIRSPTRVDNRNGPLRLRLTTASNSFSVTALSDSYGGDMPA